MDYSLRLIQRTSLVTGGITDSIFIKTEEALLRILNINL